MANEDSTRLEPDLSPWVGKDPLSIFEAAWLWAGIPPLDEVTKAYTQRYVVELDTARGWLKRLVGEVQAGRLSVQGSVPFKRGRQLTRAASASRYLGGQGRPATYAADEEDWPHANVARADLIVFAESIGQRPVFLFPDSSTVALGQSLNERVKERAQKIADEDLSLDSMTKVAAKLESEASAKRNEKSTDPLYIGQKGAHGISWYKNELKGWQPEKTGRLGNK